MGICYIPVPVIFQSNIVDPGIQRQLQRLISLQSQVMLIKRRVASPFSLFKRPPPPSLHNLIVDRNINPLYNKI